MEKQKVTIDIVSDVMCPWCYVGQKNVEEALKMASELDAEIRWQPYQLDETLPPEGKDRQQYLNEKFGGEARATEFYGRIKDAGTNVGIEFKFELMKVSPNTLDAHRVIRWAGGQGADIQNKLVERLFEMFFLEGINIGKHDVLVDAAVAAGMDGDIVKELLAGDKDKAEVQSQIAYARQLGVTGVPCFIVNSKHAVMGAQPPEALAAAMRNAASESAEENAYK